MNSISVWFSRKNLRRFDVGWSDLKGKRDNYTFWWAILGFSGGVVIQTWPLQGKVYRTIMKLAHRFNWHHTRRIYPEHDVLIVCDWCGLRYVEKRGAPVISITSGQGQEAKR